MRGNRRLHRPIPALLGAAFWLLAGAASAQTWQFDYEASLGTLPSA